jgi:hypothetical protein
MTSQKITEKKLRKIIYKILKEQGEGSGMGSGYDPSALYGAGAQGLTGAGGSGLYLPGKISFKHFQDVKQAFKDVFSTAAGATKEVLQKIFTLIKGTIAGVISVIVPALEADYDKIRKREKRNIDKIRSDYADVDRRVSEAVGDSDLATLLFFANPAAAMTGYVLVKSPTLVKGLLDVITGGTIINKESRFNEEISVDVIFEDKKDDLARVVKNKKIIRDKLSDSKVAEDLKKRSSEVWNSFLSDLYVEAKDDLEKSKTLEGLKELTNGKFEGLKFPSGAEKEQFEKLPNEDKKKLTQEVLETVQKNIKDYYLKKINSRIEQAKSTGLPLKSNTFVSDHESMIEKIKAL